MCLVTISRLWVFFTNHGAIFDQVALYSNHGISPKDILTVYNYTVVDPSQY